MLSMEVQIKSKKLIKPAVPTPSHLRNLSLSLMDVRLSPRSVPIIYYYTAQPHDYNNQPNPVEKLKRLEESLSEILTLYYPLAGRYFQETLSIDCNDEGVEFAEAHVDGELSEILHGEFEIKELNRFVPENEVEESPTNPLLSVQVNVFNCGGMAIALRTTHRLVDAFTSCLFINGWAKTCKTRNINGVPVPNFDAGVLFPPGKNEVVKLPSLSKTTSEVVTKRFVFHAKSISKLLKIEGIMTSTNGQKKQRVSSTVVIALIWRAQINAARARHGYPRRSLLTVAVNLRGKTFKKVPDYCCGNIFTLGIARYEADDEAMKNMRLSGFVDKVKDAIRKSMVGFEKLKEEEDEDENEYFSKLITRPSKVIAEEAARGDVDVHRLSSVMNFPFYQADFGWGEPEWMSLAQRPYKSVMIFDTKNGDGVEAWVTMDEEEMAYFQNDPNIKISLENGVADYTVPRSHL